jgi:hypothetical protein
VAVGCIHCCTTQCGAQCMHAAARPGSTSSLPAGKSKRAKAARAQITNSYGKRTTHPSPMRGEHSGVRLRGGRSKRGRVGFTPGGSATPEKFARSVVSHRSDIPQKCSFSHRSAASPTEEPRGSSKPAQWGGLLTAMGCCGQLTPSEPEGQSRLIRTAQPEEARVACGVWRVVCGVWCVVCGVRCAVCGVWCVVCGVWWR